jgi:glutamyl-tRNA synthetase
LLAEGKAYHCYCTPEELAVMREERMAAGEKTRYDRRWRDPASDMTIPADIAPVVRFKAPIDGATVLDDRIQGDVRFDNDQFDDIVILRGDGTPTYTLAVVVDDHDMGVSHVVRGADHLTNAFQHRFIFEALGWQAPVFGHVPLIHGADGGKLSKRHGALGVEAYREMGYLPEAMRNYLVRLGWSHGDDEMFSTEQAIAWFDLDGVGRSAARFDFDKLNSVNGHYLRQADDARLVDLVAEHHGQALSDDVKARLQRGMPGLKGRAKTLVELSDNAAFYMSERPLEMSPKAAALLNDDAVSLLSRVASHLANDGDWSAGTLEAAVRDFAECESVKLGAIAQPLRAALTGATVSPPVFEVMAALGRAETLARIEDAAG